jgi:O-antigen ligase
MTPADLKNQLKGANQPWSDSGSQTTESPAGPPVSDPRGYNASRKVKKKQGNKWHRVSLYFALALVFVRFSMIHQLLEYLLHADTYLLYFVAIPVLIAIPATGGFKRAFRFRPARFWTAFAVWLLPTSIFSSWKLGSLTFVSGFYRTELVLLFAIAGLVTNWRECRWLMYTISAAALTNLVSVLLFRKVDDDGRTNLVFGTVRNANDYSGHLIFVLPFLLWVVLTAKSRYLRVCGIGALALGLYEILAAGSRGAMIGLATAIAVFAITATSRVRRIVIVLAPLLAILAISLLPASVVHRIFLFSADNSAISEGAMESSHDREQLLKDSIATAIRHPLFGVGPGQFANVEGQQTAQAGQRLWYDAHNSFMEIASENGIAGLILYIGGVLSSLLLLNKSRRLLVGKSGVAEALAAITCVRISLISFCVTIFFLNFGYYFYLPALAGIAIALSASCKQLVAAADANQTVSRSVHSPGKSLETWEGDPLSGC